MSSLRQHAIHLTCAAAVIAAVLFAGSALPNTGPAGATDGHRLVATTRHHNPKHKATKRTKQHHKAVRTKTVRKKKVRKKLPVTPGPTTGSTTRVNPGSGPSAGSTPTPTPTPTPQATSAAPAPFIGTLVTHSSTAAQESQAGLKVAMLEASWRDLEPAQGQFSSSYSNWLRTQLQRYEAAGMRVTLGLGLHYTPQWALNLPGTRMVDQSGHLSAGIDLVFNQTVRDLAAQYLAAINQAVGLSNFWAVRIASGADMELMYPTYDYWAYSTGAQNGAVRPPSLAANPLPGWRPGDPATAAQRLAWSTWYLGALDNVADWQMDELNALGFDGYFQILTPGQGLRPAQLNAMMANGFSSSSLLGRGAVWDRIYAGLTHRANVTAYVTSVADGSGNNDVCQPSDSSVPLTSTAANGWSATRWIARIAAVNGFTVAGEVPGYPSSQAGRPHYADTSSSGELAQAMAQVRGCGLLGLYWAHDDQVWDGAVPLSAFAAYTTPNAVAPADAH